MNATALEHVSSRLTAGTFAGIRAGDHPLATSPRSNVVNEPDRVVHALVEALQVWLGNRDEKAFRKGLLTIMQMLEP